jgi:hypothetical protein
MLHLLLPPAVALPALHGNGAVLQEEARRCDFQSRRGSWRVACYLQQNLPCHGYLRQILFQSIKEMESASHCTTLHRIRSTSFKILIYHIWLPAIRNKTYHKSSYLSIDTSDSAKLGEMPQKKPDAAPEKKTIESGKEDMLGQVLQHMPALG